MLATQIGGPEEPDPLLANKCAELLWKKMRLIPFSPSWDHRRI